MSVSLDEATIQDVTRRIVNRFNPEKVVLFGSRARGDARPGSDYDFLIVAPSDEPKWRRTVPAYLELTGLLIPVDVVWWTPDEIEEWRAVRSHFINSALREGRTLYVQDSPRPCQIAVAQGEE